jgi:periplasmic protein TonB
MAAYAHDTSFFSRRAVVFIAIVALHVGLAVMLATGLARKVVEVIAPPIETNLIEELQEREEPPPPPPPEFERPPIEVPPPEVTIDIPVETTTAITDVTDKPIERKAPPAPPPPRKVVKAGMGKNFPSSEDFYPPASIRLEEEGSVGVRVCVGPNGKLAETPTVSGSSRSARLDEAAIKLAKAGRYVAGSIDGVPTTDCFSFRVKFELKK